MGLNVVLVGSDSREVEALLRAAGFTPRVAGMGELTTLAQPGVAQPDVVVLDLRGLASVPPSLTALKRQYPATPVVIVAKTLDQEFMRAAMRAGVNDWVSEPLVREDLEAAITTVVSGREKAAASQVFAIVGVKGGVGATSLAVNMATTLSRSAKAGTLLVDFHVSRGDAALYLGVEPRFSVADALENVQKLDDAFFRTLVMRTQSRLDLLAAPETLVPARTDTPRVKALVDFMSKHFEFTVLDVPRTDLGIMDGLDAAKAIVLVTTQELPAVRSAAVLAGRLRQRYGKDKVTVVMSRLDRDSEISHQDVEKTLGMPVAHVLPSDYRLATQSLNAGRPLVLDNHSALAGSIEKFSRAMAGISVEKKDKVEKNGASGASGKGGWLGKLTGRG